MRIGVERSREWPRSTFYLPILMVPKVINVLTTLINTLTETVGASTYKSTRVLDLEHQAVFDAAQPGIASRVKRKERHLISSCHARSNENKHRA